MTTQISGTDGIATQSLELSGSTGNIASFTASISGTTMTVTAVASGTIEVGQYLVSSLIFDNTYITALGTGAGGTGTYTVSSSQTAASGTVYSLGAMTNRIRITDTDTGANATQPVGVIEWIGSDSSTPGAGVAGFISVNALDTGPDYYMAFGVRDSTSGDVGAITRFQINQNGQLYNNIESQVGTDYDELYKGYLCRAWVTFNGTGTPAVRASGNVSDITDFGTGLYGVNFTTEMPDTDYCVTLAKQNPAGVNVNDIGIHNTVSGSVGTVAPTTSQFRVMLNNSLADCAYVMCAVFR